MSDRLDTSSEPNSSLHQRASEDAARSQLQALARVLGRQAAQQMWAEAMQGGAVVASTDVAEPMPKPQHSARRHARG